MRIQRWLQLCQVCIFWALGAFSAVAGPPQGQLQPDEVEPYLTAFSAREKLDQLSHFPAGDRREFPITDLMRLSRAKCVSYGYGALLRPGMNRAEREAFLLKRLNRPLYFVSNDDKMISHGDDMVEMVCLGKVLENPVLKREIDSDFYASALKLPNLTPSILTFLVNNVRPSDESVPFYQEAIANPATEPHELQHILSDAQHSQLSPRSRAALAEAVLASRSFAQEPAVLFNDLMALPIRQNTASRYAFFLRLSQVSPQPLSPFVVASSALSAFDQSLDYAPIYTALARGLPAEKRADLLEYFLYSAAHFSSGHSEVQKLLSEKNLAKPDFFFNLAASEAVKTKFLSPAEVVAMLEDELRSANLTDKNFYDIISITGSSGALSYEQKTQLLIAATEQGARSSTLATEALNAGDKLMRHNSEVEPILMPGLERAVLPFLDNAALRSNYEQLIGDLSNHSVNLEFSRRLLQLHETSGDFLDNYALFCLKDHAHPDFAAVVEILKQANVKPVTLVNLSRLLLGRFAGKAKTPGLEPLLQALAAHPLADEEVKSNVANIRDGRWDKTMSGDIFNNLMK